MVSDTRLRPRTNLFKRPRHCILGHGDIVVRLQADPKAIGPAEKPRQAKPGIGRDGARARDDLADPPLRHADLIGEPLLGDLHRLEEFLDENFTGTRVGNSAQVVLRQW